MHILFHRCHIELLNIGNQFKCAYPFSDRTPLEVHNSRTYEDDSTDEVSLPETLMTQNYYICLEMDEEYPFFKSIKF